MSTVGRQRVIQAIEGYLEEERGEIPDHVVDGLESLHDSLQQGPTDSISPGQQAAMDITNGQPLERYPTPFDDTPSPGERAAQASYPNE